MKTPMQEHIEFLKKEWLIVKNLESLGYIGVALHIGDCIKHAESMLEKEEEVIMDAYDTGLFDGSMDDVDDRLYKYYYNEIFKMKER